MNSIKKSIAKLLIMLCLSLSITPVLGLNLPTTITVDAASYSKTTIKSVQKKLNNLGYDCGTADGIAGSKTKKAIKSYQKKEGLSQTGSINQTLLDYLGIKATYASTSNSASKSSSNSSESDKTNSATVYITNTGSKYHSSGCRYLRQSKKSISLSDAKSSGYDACSVCRP